MRVWILNFSFLFPIVITLISVLVILIMSKTREASTLAIVLASIAISLGLLAIPNESLDVTSKSVLGVFVGFMGIFYGEMVTWRESREGRMLKKKKSKISSLRFITSLLIRSFQVIPLIVWFYVLFPSWGITIILSLLFLVFVLSVNEHYRLWK